MLKTNTPLKPETIPLKPENRLGDDQILALAHAAIPMLKDIETLRRHFRFALANITISTIEGEAARATRMLGPVLDHLDINEQYWRNRFFRETREYSPQNNDPKLVLKQARTTEDGQLLAATFAEGEASDDFTPSYELEEAIQEIREIQTQLRQLIKKDFELSASLERFNIEPAEKLSQKMSQIKKQAEELITPDDSVREPFAPENRDILSILLEATEQQIALTPEYIAEELFKKGYDKASATEITQKILNLDASLKRSEQTDLRIAKMLKPNDATERGYYLAIKKTPIPIRKNPLKAIENIEGEDRKLLVKIIKFVLKRRVFDVEGRLQPPVLEMLLEVIDRPDGEPVQSVDSAYLRYRYQQLYPHLPCPTLRAFEMVQDILACEGEEAYGIRIIEKDKKWQPVLSKPGRLEKILKEMEEYEKVEEQTIPETEFRQRVKASLRHMYVPDKEFAAQTLEAMLELSIAKGEFSIKEVYEEIVTDEKNFDRDSQKIVKIIKTIEKINAEAEEDEIPSPLGYTLERLRRGSYSLRPLEEYEEIPLDYLGGHNPVWPVKIKDKILFNKEEAEEIKDSLDDTVTSRALALLLEYSEKGRALPAALISHMIRAKQETVSTEVHRISSRYLRKKHPGWEVKKYGHWAYYVCISLESIGKFSEAGPVPVDIPNANEGASPQSLNTARKILGQFGIDVAEQRNFLIEGGSDRRSRRACLNDLVRLINKRKEEMYSKWSEDFEFLKCEVEAAISSVGKDSSVATELIQGLADLGKNIKRAKKEINDATFSSLEDSLNKNKKRVAETFEKLERKIQAVQPKEKIKPIYPSELPRLDVEDLMKRLRPYTETFNKRDERVLTHLAVYLRRLQAGALITQQTAQQDTGIFVSIREINEWFAQKRIPYQLRVYIPTGQHYYFERHDEN
ncbi:MAG: hypothetical protein PHP74_03120 [Candidatus Gracilibacteria bacterium]|nr:hypothetical protein [Candidatus Gracilibacteria bacterium]